MNQYVFRIQGECGLVIDFGERIDFAVNSRVHLLCQKISRLLARRIEAVIPTYRSLLILFDPLLISRLELQIEIDSMMTESTLSEDETKESIARVVTIPTLYGGEAGPDLEFVARHNQLTAEEVIEIHASTAYKIYMMGFTPGFPYLGGMSEKIAAPRLMAPRSRIPPGSVGIAGTQTGLYPQASPGGWQLIGRTPLQVFDPAKQEPFLYKAGDYLRFEPISAVEYERIEARIAAGTYQAKISLLAEVVR